MKYSNSSGIKVECSCQDGDLHMELDARLSKLGFSMMMEAPEVKPEEAPPKRATRKKKAAPEVEAPEAE